MRGANAKFKLSEEKMLAFQPYQFEHLDWHCPNALRGLDGHDYHYDASAERRFRAENCAGEIALDGKREVPA